MVEVVFGGRDGLQEHRRDQSEIVATSSGDALAHAVRRLGRRWRADQRGGRASQHGPKRRGDGTPGPSVSVAQLFLRDPFNQPLARHRARGQRRGLRARSLSSSAAARRRCSPRFVAIGTGERQGTAPPPSTPAGRGTEVNAVRQRRHVARPPRRRWPTSARRAVRRWPTGAARRRPPASRLRPERETRVVKPTRPAARSREARDHSPYDVVGKTIRADAGRHGRARRRRPRSPRLPGPDRRLRHRPVRLALLHQGRRRRDGAGQGRRRGARRGQDGALLGIPVAVKDLYDTKDMPTTHGSQVFEGFRPTKDAFQVRKMREAGAIIIGKTTMAESPTPAASPTPVGPGVERVPAVRDLDRLVAAARRRGRGVACAFSMGQPDRRVAVGPERGAGLESLRGTDGLSSG